MDHCSGSCDLLCLPFLHELFNIVVVLPRSAKMLRVFRPSGEEVLAIQFVEFVERVGIGQQPIRALDLKRHLQGLCRQVRFRQRLLLPDGQILSDNATLDGPMDVQLILLSIAEGSEEQVRQLREAAVQNDMAALEQLLQSPLDPDFKIGCTTTPLFSAASHGRVEAVRVLLEARADKDSAADAGITPIFAASFNGHMEVVRLLLEAKADKNKADRYGTRPMTAARRNRHMEVFRLLQEFQADKDKASPQQPMRVGTQPMPARGCNDCSCITGCRLVIFRTQRG